MADEKDFDDVTLEDEEYPPNLCCPISLTLMHEPVILIEDCVTYEKSMLEDWFKSHNTSPMTNKILKSKKFISNLAIKKQIDEYNFRKNCIESSKFLISFNSVSNNFNTQNCIKLLLVGDCSVGKTSLKKYIEFGNIGKFIQPTIGVESSYVKFNDIDVHNTINKDVIIRITDICGQFDRFRSVTKQCYRGIHGAVLVCSLDCSESVNNLKNNWLDDIYENAPDNVHGIVIINKCDLLNSVSKNDYVFVEQRNKYEKLMRTAIQFANYVGYSVYCCSCLTGEYVHLAFKELVVRIIRDNDVWNDIQDNGQKQIDGAINVREKLLGNDNLCQYEGCMFALKSLEKFAVNAIEKIKMKF